MKNSSKRFTRLNVVLAFCLIAIGLLVNPWLLGYLLQPSSISLTSKIFIGAFEIFFIISGLLVYFKGNAPEKRKRLVFGFITFALVILIIEAGLHIISFVTQGDQEQSEIIPKYSLSPYEGKEWARTYWEEIGEFSPTSDYKPFVGWKYGPYHGEYINVNSEGVRKTWNPEHARGKIPNTIYVFGGSTIWGYGARDDYTIPSYLSKLLNNSNYTFDVYNYGEWAYSLTQETIYLTLLLREGHRPDYVIFYGGANEVYAAYQSGIPDAHYNQLKISEKLSTKSTIRDSVSYILNRAPGILAKYSKICLVIDKAIERMFVSGSTQQQFGEVASKYDDEELRLLSAGITESYLKSMKFLDQLAQSYGFEYAYFWQPTTFTEKKLTDEETTTDTRVNDKHYGSLQQMTHAFLVAEAPPHFFSIIDALGDRTETYYIDFVHVSEMGNEVIATKILQIFEKEFLQE